jgi:hypothetical protein
LREWNGEAALPLAPSLLRCLRWRLLPACSVVPVLRLRESLRSLAGREEVDAEKEAAAETEVDVEER